MSFLTNFLVQEFQLQNPKLWPKLRIKNGILLLIGLMQGEILQIALLHVVHHLLYLLEFRNKFICSYAMFSTILSPKICNFIALAFKICFIRLLVQNM